MLLLLLLLLLPWLSKTSVFCGEEMLFESLSRFSARSVGSAREEEEEEEEDSANNNTGGI